ncbi:MAG: hypoxanthine phosphoribosyltransferase [Candidatus Tectomicrobia bacterium]|uniref:Hypoxanthine phosphoribosyltransferase n=1 Tax=Tectimicrobiota bacterium TaxID=2528274 RepID=A0A932CQJ4_UNCTE|nr:hypoxanthine phosphoribosyltransferase [Candidatus Tectomicrobia bacterium]
MEGLGEILLTAEEISQRVKELGEAITRDYQGLELRLVAILKGATVFLADLMRAISLPLTLDFMAISSYGGGTSSSGVVKILKDLDEGIEGTHILVVEDIVDTGLTLSYLLRTLSVKNPASLKTCILLDRPARRIVDLSIAYKGFEIPDRFVIGYGLDYRERYRNLPFICTIEPQ